MCKNETVRKKKRIVNYHRNRWKIWNSIGHDFNVKLVTDFSISIDRLTNEVLIFCNHIPGLLVLCHLSKKTRTVQNIRWIGRRRNFDTSQNENVSFTFWHPPPLTQSKFWTWRRAERKLVINRVDISGTELDADGKWPTAPLNEKFSFIVKVSNFLTKSLMPLSKKLCLTIAS